MSIKLVAGSEILNVVSVYAPQVELSEEIKRLFWEGMANCIRRSAREVLGVSREGSDRMKGAWWWSEDVKRKVKAFSLGGDFNGHIGSRGEGYEMVHGGLGYGVRNSWGVSILDFAVAYELSIVNSYFRKRDEHLVTFRNGSARTQIDYFLMRVNSRR